MTWSWRSVSPSFRERRGNSRKYTPPPSVPMQSRSHDLSKWRTVTRVALRGQTKCDYSNIITNSNLPDVFKEPCYTCSSQCPAFQGGCSCSLPADRRHCLAFHLPPLGGCRLPAPTDESYCHPVVTASGPFPHRTGWAHQFGRHPFFFFFFKHQPMWSLPVQAGSGSVWQQWCLCAGL